MSSVAKKLQQIRIALAVLIALITSNLALAMTFEKQERCVEGINPKCQMMILAIGQIDKDTPKQLKAFAKDFLNCCQFRSTTKESFSIVNHCSNMG
jgi:hypothetical protein